MRVIIRDLNEDRLGFRDGPKRRLKERVDMVP